MRLLQQCFSLIEPALVNYEKSSPYSSTLPYICKLSALKLDLQQLGDDDEKNPERPKLILIDNTGAYLGARYVLEGSAQGGLFIASCLEKSLPEVSARAFRFWSLQRQVAQHWPAFLTMLAQLDNDVPAQEQAVPTAIEAFDIFLAVFSGINDVRAD